MRINHPCFQGSILHHSAFLSFYRLLPFGAFLLIMLIGIVLVSCQPSAPKTGENTESTTKTDTTTQITTRQNVVIFGNSLTAGYGLEPEQAYPALIQQKVDSLQWPFTIVNAGLSGETTAGGVTRIEWALKQSIDVFVLELGGNDGLRGIDPKLSEANLRTIIHKVRNKYPKADIVLAGMQAPPNMGQEYTKAFQSMYKRIADTEKVALIPFLLEGVGGIKALNLPDGIHPTVEGQKIVANTVWAILSPVLAARVPKPGA
jgi:acyl-CoA thioesterase I